MSKKPDIQVLNVNNDNNSVNKNPDDSPFQNEATDTNTVKTTESDKYVQQRHISASSGLLVYH